MATALVAEGEQVRVDDDGSVSFQNAAGIWNPGSPTDLVQEVDGTLYVVDPHPNVLHVFQRTEAGEWERVREVQLQHHVTDMIVRDEQVLLLSRNDFIVHLALSDDGVPIRDEIHTVVTTVNLGEETEVIHQRFAGTYADLNVVGDRLLMKLSDGNDVVIAIYPPPELTSRLHGFQITPDGLVEIDSVEVPRYGSMEVRGDDIFVVRNHHVIGDILLPPGEVDANGQVSEDHRILPEIARPQATVIRYQFGEDSIEPVADLDLPDGAVSGFQVSRDGFTAVAFRSVYSGIGIDQRIDLLDLSDNDLSLFESVPLGTPTAQWLSVIDMGPDEVVLADYESNELVIVNTNQEIDINNEGRVTRVAVPEGWRTLYRSIRVTSDRLVIAAVRETIIETPESAENAGIPNDADPNSRQHRETKIESGLLTLSLSRNEIIAATVLPDNLNFGLPDFTLIDSELQWFGYHSTTHFANRAGTQFVFGTLSDEGEFVIDGRVRVGGYYGEVDANRERLIVRFEDRLHVHDWENLEEPTVIPLGELRPPVEAVDDVLTINFDGESDARLDVLANDVASSTNRLQIVELIGAPEGTEIVGRFVKIPAEALRDVESLRFEYVISDGFSQSQAVVEVSVEAFDAGAFERLVRQIVEQAAEDFGIAADLIDVTSVERFIGEPLPYVPPDDPNHPIDLSPGVLVTMRFPGGSALYGGSLDGRIIQIFASQREFLASLGLQAVSAEGDVLDEIVVGDEFFLEFQAKDLRQFGEGVFAAFFDLELPNDLLTLTGDVEYLEGFGSVNGSTINDGGIDELGAVSTEIDHPGSELQRLLRVGVRALGAGDLVLQINPADEQGNETLLRGIDTEIDSSQVQYLPLELAIVAEASPNPLDADGNGNVTAGDALVVVNFLGRHGNMTLEELEALAGNGEGEGLSPSDIEAMRRYDTNRSGAISALDALVVINNMERDENVATAEAENSTVQPGLSSADIDDDDEEAAGVDSNQLF